MPKLSKDWSAIPMEKRKADAQMAINKAKVAILRHPTFCQFSGVIARGWSGFKDIGTAATDGQRTWYDPTFICDSQLQDPRYTRFVVLHEAVHKAYSHIDLWAKRLRKEYREDMTDDEINEVRFNNWCEQAAADIFVNSMLKEMDPNEAFIRNYPWAYQAETWAKNLSVGDIYRLLKARKQQPSGESQDGHKLPDPKEIRVPFEEFKKIIEQEMRTGKLSSIAARGSNKSAGDQAGNDEFDITEFGHNRIPWYETLRELFIENSVLGNDHTSWSRVNRRMMSGYDLYMPSMVGHTCGPLVIQVDTSGSVSDEELREAMGALQGLVQECNPTMIYLLWVDYVVANVQEIYPGEYNTLSSVIRPAGRGGTDMRKGFQWLEEKKIKPAAMITFTDGETPFPTSVDFPTYWVMTTRAYIAPEEAGTTLYLD